MSLTDILAANPSLRTRGFLPAEDPFPAFPDQSPFGVLDRIGDDLPGLLKKGPAFRTLSQVYRVPLWPADCVGPEYIPALRLYYMRLAWWISAYVHQIGEAPVSVVPANMAVPLVHAARLLDRPPILSYDGYALYNWKRLDPTKPIELGNIDTFQNFVDLYDEHWFILVHVDIEHKAARILDAIARLQWNDRSEPENIDEVLADVTKALGEMTGVLKRIPEHMRPELYHSDFRPYIGPFRGIVYEGVSSEPVHLRGETGAQSSIFPLLRALLKIVFNHTEGPAGNEAKFSEFIDTMRMYMPARDRALLAAVDALPDFKPFASRHAWNATIEAMAVFLEHHLRYAIDYIFVPTGGAEVGTGGSYYRAWLANRIIDIRANAKA